MFPSQSGSWYDKKMSSLGGPDSLAPTPHTSETASERSRMGPATLWVPVHCGREDVENAPPRLPTQARLGRTGLYTRCSYALRPKNYLIPSYSERRGLRRPWEGGRRWRRSSVGADVGPGLVYKTLDGKGLTKSKSTVHGARPRVDGVDAEKRVDNNVILKILILLFTPRTATGA